MRVFTHALGREGEPATRITRYAADLPSGQAEVKPRNGRRRIREAAARPPRVFAPKHINIYQTIRACEASIYRQAMARTTTYYLTVLNDCEHRRHIIEHNIEHRRPGAVLPFRISHAHADTQERKVAAARPTVDTERVGRARRCRLGGSALPAAVRLCGGDTQLAGK